VQNQDWAVVTTLRKTIFARVFKDIKDDIKKISRPAAPEEFKFI
jgi:hypothetical protein